jgi:hypothetical protein
LIATTSNAEGEFKLWNDPWIIVDILLIFACAYGIYKKSRFAAILLFCYFIFAKIVIGLETGKMSGIGLALVFLFFYGKAIQGTFVYHRLEKAENPNYKVTPKWVYFTVLPALVIFLLLMGIGLMTMTGVLPSTEVQVGSQILQGDREVLVSNGVVTQDDNIEYFYSYGLSSILEGGSVLTGNRVILYKPDENQQMGVYALYYNEITDVELVTPGSTFEDSVYRINSYTPDAWLQIPLSVENEGDIKFIEALRSKITNGAPGEALQQTSH